MNLFTMKHILSYLEDTLNVTQETPEFVFLYSYIVSCLEQCKTVAELKYFLPEDFDYWRVCYTPTEVKMDLELHKAEFFKLYYFYKGLKIL